MNVQPRPIYKQMHNSVRHIKSFFIVSLDFHIAQIWLSQLNRYACLSCFRLKYFWARCCWVHWNKL